MKPILNAPIGPARRWLVKYLWRDDGQHGEGVSIVVAANSVTAIRKAMKRQRGLPLTTVMVEPI